MKEIVKLYIMYILKSENYFWSITSAKEVMFSFLSVVWLVDLLCCITQKLPEFQWKGLNIHLFWENLSCAD